MSSVPHDARAKAGEVGGSSVDAEKSAGNTRILPVDTCAQRSPVTVSALAKSLGVSARQVRDWCATGKVRALQTPGGHWRIPRDEANRLLGGRARAA